jgi:outer-membrane receptor for ferric coprogen and ferric-rhodotorulic acid
MYATSRLACTAALLALALSSPPALAQSVDAASHQYDLDAGPLGLVLSRYAAQAGVVLSFDTRLTADKQSPGLSGRYSVESGFAALLAGSGLELVAQGNGRYGLRASNSVTLDPVQVSGSPVPPPSENTGSYTVGLTDSATRLPMTLRETPQSVSVITRQRLEDQGLNTLEDAIVNTPGVIFKKKASADDNDRSLFARGMEITNIQVDGVPQNQTFNALGFDTALYDRIEIVRGSTGLLSGAGNPSATLNLIRKRPTGEFQASANAAIGSWDFRRTDLDLSGPINASGSVRGRLVGAWQEGGSYLDRLKQDSQLLYGVVEADVADRTRATLGFEYQRKKCTACSYFGLPAYFSDGTPTDFRRGYNSATNWSRQLRTRTNLFGTIDHEFSDTWRGSLTYSHSREHNDRAYGWFSSNGSIDAATGAGSSLWVAKWPIPTTQDSIDGSLNGSFEALGRRHDLMFGANLTRTRTDTTNYPLWRSPGYAATVNSIWGWNGDMPEPDWQANGRYNYEQKQGSVYAAARLRPTETLSLVLGSRMTWFTQDSDYRYTDGSSGATDMRRRGVYTPYAGLVLDLTNNVSAYASYTSIFQPQSAQTVSGDTLAPVEGNTYEVGLKSAWLDNRLNASIALFDTRQDNYAVADGDNLAPNGDNAYVAANGARLRGVEAELSGELTRDWQMQLSYAYVDRRLPQGFSTIVGLPRHIAKLYTTYRVPDTELTVGGGVRWESLSRYGYSGGVQLQQDSYAVVDLMARYRFNRNWSATLNLNNVFDKKYYASTNIYSVYYGTPFNAMLTVNYRY